MADIQNNVQNNKALEEEIQKRLNDKNIEAESLLGNKDKVEETLQNLEKLLQTIPTVGDWLADVPAVISMVRSYIRKEYQNIPTATIVTALGAILYIISPIDIIPDAVPVVGRLDDAAVFAWCWTKIHKDVDAYQAWRKENGKEL